ncbi:hypothetical protein TNCV_2834261 [Trichonephila clavipes]|nr:hypothetical protein TNCV_2834261 [Trichonephila clavipes]
MLGRQIAVLSQPSSSITELKRALQEAWKRLSPQLIHHLIPSMSRLYAYAQLLAGVLSPPNKLLKVITFQSLWRTPPGSHLEHQD